MTSYRWDPVEYNRHSSMQAGFAEGLLDRLSITGSERLLDIGCGDGKITAHLSCRLPRGAVCGIDLSPEMVSFARRSFPESAYPNLTFQVADAARLPFRERFDWVVSFAALHWIHDHHPVLSGIAHSLLPGGRLLVQCGGHGNGGPLFDLAGDIIRSPRWQSYFTAFSFPWRFYSATEYETLVRDAGLVPARVEVVLREARHLGRAGFAGWMRSTWIPYLQRLPVELWDVFIAEVTDRYLAACPIQDGLIRVPMMRLEVEASKPGN